MSTYTVPRPVGSMKQMLAEREREHRRSVSTLIVYNASDMVVVRNVNNHLYKLYPDAAIQNIHTGEMETYDGMNEITDQLGPNEAAMAQWRKGGGQRSGAPMPPWDSIVMHAFDVVKHIINKDERVGLAVLIGTTDEQNDKLKQEAKAQFVSFKRVQCQKILDNHRVRTMGLQPGDPGKLMRNDELAADRWMTRYNAGQFQKKRYQCPQGCGFWSYEPADVPSHVEDKHKIFNAAPEGPDQPDDEGVPETPAKRSTRKDK